MDLEIIHVKKKFGKRQVLQDISFTAKAGECIGIIGGNGCGKTTLLSILAGTVKADEGSCIWKGMNLFQHNKLRSEVMGYVPQGTPLFDELSAKDNLRLWYDRKTLKQELDTGVLSMLAINEFLNIPVSKLSGGMKKRLSIGCAVAGKPQVLLLDEPTAALDLVCKQQILEYLMDYRQKGGIALLVTHDISEIEHCDRCYLISDGKLVEYVYDGDVEHLVGQL